MNIRELVENKSSIIAQKKAVMKRGEGLPFSSGDAAKITVKEDGNPNELKVKAVINTTNVIDSHGDLHIKGLWTKSLKENKNIMYLQEHEMKFNKIIADGADVKAYTENTTFEALGFKDVSGPTQALVFEATVKADRNPYMFKQLKDGNVRESSVGMRYIQMDLAVNDEAEYYKEEKKVWDKYYPDIANKGTADERGYFWVVKQAAVIEGSAVVKGSNQYTPVEVEAATGTKAENGENGQSADTQQKRNNLLNFLN